MKIPNTFSKTVMFLVIVFVSITMYAQNPTYECRIMNDHQISPTVYQFDIVIYQTNSTVLNLNNYQLSFKISNLANILNDGKLASNYIVGSSQLPNFFPSGTSLLPAVSPNYFRVNGPNASSESIIIPTTGLRIGTFQITNSVPFGQAKMDLVWNNSAPAFTSVRAMVVTSPYPVNITAFSNSHTTAMLNPILNLNITPYNSNNYSNTNGNASIASTLLDISDVKCDTREFYFGIFPNPFVSNTELEYNLIESGNVSIILYNSLGEKIAVLVNEVKNVGLYKFKLNASDMAAGIYSCEILLKGKTSDYKKILKLVKR